MASSAACSLIALAICCGWISRLKPAAMAKAIGIDAIRLEDPADVDQEIAAAFAHDGPVLIDAVVNRSELAMPPSITVEMAKGFTLYMVQAVIGGRADEVIDLAKTNVRR